jgi:pimeloyl-ACP methyl ester carboxylesterase
MDSEPIPDRAGEGGTLPRGPGASIAYSRRTGRTDLPGVMFLGGFNSDMTGVKAVHLDRFCATRNQPYLRFDYQGHGASSTRFEDCTIGLWLDDALAALDHLTAGPQILVGSSMGGWLALLVALKRPDRVAGLVGIAAATDFTEHLIWVRLSMEQRRMVAQQGFLRVPSAYDSSGYVITRQLIDEGRRHLLLDAPIQLAIPVRLLHGMQDPDVPWQRTLGLADALTTNDIVVSLIKDGDHRLSRPQDLERLTATVAELSRS